LKISRVHADSRVCGANPLPDSPADDGGRWLRSALLGVVGVALIGGTCVLVVIHALIDQDSYGSADAAAIGALGAVAVLVSVLRWSPSLDDESIRRVSRSHSLILLAVSIAVGAAALARPGRSDVSVGVLSSLCLLNVYLGCWGFRSLFLLRRVMLFSVLSWPVAADIVVEFVGKSLTGLSDLVFRRLGSLGLAAADDHPWRVLSAMTEHATVAVVGVVVLTLAASRLRLSVAAVARLLVGCSLVVLVHHTLLLSAPIESYHRSWWADVASGPIIELALAGLFAVVLFSPMSVSTSDDHASSPSPDRDPEIFGDQDDAGPVIAIRLCSVVVPAALMTLAVLR